MIDKATIDKVIDSTEIVDVISDFVTLRRKGANYMACCPFHDEKTPSFSVSPSKGIFKCFGCGKAGSAVTFVMEHEQLTYVEAIKYLGKKYGIEVIEKEESAEDVAQRLKHESLVIVSEFAQKVFSDLIFSESLFGAIGLSYFKESRGFTEETIRKFGLGFSPDDRTFLTRAALKAGYKEEFLTETGLCFKKDNGELADKFFDRAMFPIHSLTGRVIAFGGRTMKAEKNIAKYLNSPESEIYHKSKILYGIYFAKSSIAKNDKCYLVEGYTDVISMHQAGIENIVASSGTSLTKEQIRLIRRFTSNVTVLYDGDSAGIKASIRGIDLLLEEGLTVKVALFPENQDPDSFARSHTKEELITFLTEKEQDFIEFKLDLYAGEMTRDPIKRARVISEIVGSIALIPDQIVRSVYIEECADKLRIKQEILFSEVNKARHKRLNSSDVERDRQSRYKEAGIYSEPVQKAEESRKSSGVNKEAFLEPAERDLIYYLLKFGETELKFSEDQENFTREGYVTVAQYIESELLADEIEFSNPIYKVIFEEYFQVRKDWSEQEKILKYFHNHQDPQITKAVLDIIMSEHTVTVKEYRKSLVPEENVLTTSVPKAVSVFKSKVLDVTYQLLSERLGEAEKTGDQQAISTIMNQMKILMQVRNMVIKNLNRLT